MAITSAIRGNAYNMRTSGGYPNGTPYNAAQISISAGDLGSVFVMTNTGVVKYISWHMAKNSPNGRTMSLLFRIAPDYTGTPAAARALVELNSGASGSGALMTFFHNNAGNIIGTGRNQAGAVTFNGTNFGAWSPTQGQYYDIVFKWDGTTTAGAGSLTIDNGTPTTATASNALDVNWDQYYWKSLSLGAVSGVTVSALSGSEIVLWDTLIDTSSVQLDSGTGALSGSTRTSYVFSPAANGSASSNNQLKTSIGSRNGW